MHNIDLKQIFDLSLFIIATNTKTTIIHVITTFYSIPVSILFIFFSSSSSSPSSSTSFLHLFILLLAYYVTLLRCLQFVEDKFLHRIFFFNVSFIC